ncbi:MAG: branched-chain amino acid aminotransferase [Thermodesulfobacteriota bacterium]|nr:branched-chain amino acid aminotransferase [Thermodesulfobacteriota bacterium]
MKLTITEKDKKGTRPEDSALGFGTIFTDHMFNMDYSSDKGWHNPRIEPFKDFSLSPATMMLHYGQAVFEGMKAYKSPSGNIQLFRPEKNFERMNKSSKGLCIPEIDIEFVMDCLKELLKLEKDWIPTTIGTSLYIRPTIIATDAFLGVRASDTYRFFIILSPVGAYYATGVNPVKIAVSKEHVRAVRGGVGEYKTPGNYAASLYASEKAKKEGYAQVLWLDGVELKYIEEVGAMNIFFYIGDELVTPELNGSILPGITRYSVIDLAKKWGIKVSERKISIDELMAAHKDGTLKEAFGSGTAAVISPVGEIKYDDKIMEIGNGKIGPLALKFHDAITDIQYGKAEDSENWLENVE